MSEPNIKEQYLAVLEGRHGSSVNVEVGIDLDGRGFQTHHLAEHSDAGGRHPLADPAQHSA